MLILNQMLNINKIFKNVIIIHFLIFWIYLFLDLNLNSNEWFSNNEISADENLSTIEMINSIFVLLLLPVWLFVLYSLYKFKLIGKKLLIPILILMEIVVYTSLSIEELTNTHKILYFINCLDYFLIGMIITFVYFSDVSKEFKK